MCSAPLLPISSPPAYSPHLETLPSPSPPNKVYHVNDIFSSTIFRTVLADACLTIFCASTYRFITTLLQSLLYTCTRAIPSEISSSALFDSAPQLYKICSSLREDGLPTFLSPTISTQLSLWLLLPFVTTKAILLTRHLRRKSRGQNVEGEEYGFDYLFASLTLHATATTLLFMPHVISFNQIWVSSMPIPMIGASIAYAFAKYLNATVDIALEIMEDEVDFKQLRK